MPPFGHQKKTLTAVHPTPELGLRRFPPKKQRGAFPAFAISSAFLLRNKPCGSPGRSGDHRCPQRLVGDLQHQPLVGGHTLRLRGGDAEELGVEEVQVRRQAREHEILNCLDQVAIFKPLILKFENFVENGELIF